MDTPWPRESERIRFNARQRYFLAPLGLLMGVTLFSISVFGILITSGVISRLGPPSPFDLAVIAMLGGLGPMICWSSAEMLLAWISIDEQRITKRSGLGQVVSIGWGDVVRLRWSHFFGYVLESRHGEVIRIDRGLAKPTVVTAIQSHLGAVQARGFPTADLRPPQDSQPPAVFTWGIALLLAGGFAWQLDWRHLDAKCLQRSVLAAFAKGRTTAEEPRLCLHLAAHENDVPWLEALLERGADPDQKDAFERTALAVAVERGHVRVTEALLAAGADPFLPSVNGALPIVQAIRADERAIVRAMVVSSLARIDDDRATLLYAVAHSTGRLRIADFLRGQLGDRLPAVADPEVAQQYEDKMKWAEAALRDADYAKARRLAEEAITIDPRVAPAYLVAGYAYLAEDNFGKAKERARFLVERFPVGPDGWQLLGSIHLETGDYGAAEDAFTKALDVGPRNRGSVLADRALARLEAGHRAEALADARAACDKHSQLGCDLVEEIATKP